MTFDFESTFSRIADRAVIRRKPAESTLPPYRSPLHDRWQRLVQAMGSGWHTKADLADQCGLTFNQIHRLFTVHRKQLQLRGHYHRAYWRLK